MASYISTIKESLSAYPENSIIIARELYAGLSSVVPEQTFYKALERLCDSGKLVHLSKGMYYRPKESKYGIVPLGTEEIVRFYTENNKGIVTGYALFNEKGITTQIPKRIEILSNFIEEEKRNIQNVSVKKIPLEMTEQTVSAIEALEILQSYNSIEDINNDALARYLTEFASGYSEKAVEKVLASLKYKKSTIAFLEAILNYHNVKNTLRKYLSPLSKYNIPDMEVLYAPAQ